MFRRLAMSPRFARASDFFIAIGAGSILHEKFGYAVSPIPLFQSILLAISIAYLLLRVFLPPRMNPEYSDAK